MNGAVLLKTNYEVPIDSSNDFDPIFYYLSLTLLKAPKIRAEIIMSPEKQRWHVGFVERKWNWHRCIISIGAWYSSLGGVERLTAPSLSSLSIYLFYYFFLSLIKLVLQPYDSFIFCTWLFPIFKQLQS